ncbi:MFS transporter [Micromonospora mirobrigensis]|uniref:Major Facilitator Superfamily protein n=1 Tax=Micromonospora mirobrigensis TaxID=262898 RepID=A0A1C4ZC31_9ACTN|nr:MFS transporter [Micromonospora mirobrigensis]SCF30396.1 Major Facilitator Superfamily protein [Micromonospora mirobrigensis]
MSRTGLQPAPPEAPRIGQAGRVLIAATALSALGNSMYIGAAALLVLQLTRDPASVPLIAICGGIPAIVMAPLVPRAIKRFGAATVAIAADLVSAAAAAVYPVLFLLALHNGPEIVYAQELVIGSAAAFYSTSARILVSALSASSASVLIRINGYSIATTQIAGVIGWGLGALTLALSNAAVAMFANAVTFVLSALLQWRVRDDLRSAQQRGEETESPAGDDPPSRWYLPHPLGVLATAGLVVVFTTTQRLWLSNYPAVLELVLGKPDWTLGVANVAYSAGAILAGVLIAGRVQTPSVRVAVLVICGFYALCALVTFTSPLPLMLAVYCLVGLASIGVVLAQSRLQLDLPLSTQSTFFARLLAVQNASNLVFLSLWIPLLRLSDPRTLIVITLTTAAVLTILLGVTKHDHRPDHVRQ